MMPFTNITGGTEFRQYIIFTNDKAGAKSCYHLAFGAHLLVFVSAVINFSPPF